MRYSAGLAYALSFMVSAAAAAQTPPAAAPAEPAAAWVPRGEAELQVLDKINARAETIAVRDGAQGQVGSLTIAVRSCLVRPPDRPADATAFVVITDAHPDAPHFRGWMFHDEPAASMLEHPIYDVRLLGCRP